MNFTQRFQFIAHALNGDGPFRPVVSYDGYERAASVSTSYLVKYPRESEEKFARRNEIAFYSSPLAQVCSRFVSYLASKPVARAIANDLLTVVAGDADGKGNVIDIFWQDFMVNAKARGTMLLLVDMPSSLPGNQGAQLAGRVAPYWTPIFPETIKECVVGEDGKFDFVSFPGIFKDKPCVWYFDRAKWVCFDEKQEVRLDQGTHNLGECPVLIYTETSTFPCFGAFSPIADMSKRLFNLDSELDEILRSQTFSLLTMQLPENASGSDITEAAIAAGTTISTQNMLMHKGTTPAFIAPDNGPATIYINRIKQLEERIEDVGLIVAGSSEKESGIALQMRFHAINSELARFSARMESLERRAWALSAKWLGLSEEPAVSWPRDFNIADVEQELSILSDMIASSMSQEVIIEQQKRIVSVQFNGSDSEAVDDLTASLDQGEAVL